jgi:hypothetical protein
MQTVCPDLSVIQGLGVSAVAVLVAGAKAGGATAGALRGIALTAALVTVSDGPEFTKGSAWEAEGVAPGATVGTTAGTAAGAAAGAVGVTS